MSFTEPPFTTYLLEHLTQWERDVISPVLLGEGEITTILPGQGIFVEQDPRTIVVKLLEIDRGVLTTDQRDIIHRAMDYFARMVSPDHALHELEAGRTPATNTPSVPNVIAAFLQTIPPVIQEQLIAILGKAKLPRGVERIPFTGLRTMVDTQAVHDYLERVWETGLNRAEMDLLQDLKVFVTHYLASPPMVAGATQPSERGEPRPLHPLELPIGAKKFTVPVAGVLWHWVLQDHEALAAHFLANKEFVPAAQHLLAAANTRFKTRDFKTAANLAAQAYFLLAFVQDNVGEKADHPYLLIEAALLECQACLRTLQHERVEIILSDVKSRIETCKATDKKTDSIYDELARLEKLYTALKGCLDSVLESQSLRPEHYVALFRTLYDHPLGWMTRRAAHAMALAWRKGGLDTPESLFAGLSEMNPTLGIFYAFDARIAFYARDQEAMGSWVTGAEQAHLYDLLYHVQLDGGDANAAYDTLLKKIATLLKAHRTVAAMGTGEAALNLAVDCADSSDGKSHDFYQLVAVYQQALADQTLDASYKDNLVVFIAALYDRWFIHLKRHGFDPVAVLVELTRFLLDRGRGDMAGDILAKHLRAMEDSAINLAPGLTSALPIVFSEIVDGIDSAYCPVAFLTKDGAVVLFFLGHPRFLKGVLHCLAMIFAKEDNKGRIPGSYYQKLANAMDDVTIPARDDASNWVDEIKAGGVYEVDGRNHTLQRVVQESEALPLAIDILMQRGRDLLAAAARDSKRKASLSHDAAIAFNQAYVLGVQWGVDDKIISVAAGYEAIAWNDAEINEPALIAALDTLSRMEMASTVGHALKTKLREAQPWLSQNLDMYNLLVSINDAIRGEGSQPSRRAIIGCCVLADAVLAQDAITELFHKLLEMHLSPKEFISRVKGYAALAQGLDIPGKYKQAITELADKIVYTSEDPEPEPSGPGGGRRVEPLTLRVVSNQPATSPKAESAGKRGEPDGGAAAILAGTRVITGGNPLLAATPLVLEQGVVIFQAPEVITTVPDSTAQSSTTPAPVQPESDLAPPPVDDAFAPIHPGLVQPARATLHRGGLRLVTGK